MERVDALDALLDDVVAVLVLDALEDVPLQFGDDELQSEMGFNSLSIRFRLYLLSYLLLVDGDALEGLLDDPTAVHLQGELLDVGSELEAKTGDSYFILLSLQDRRKPRFAKVL